MHKMRIVKSFHFHHTKAIALPHCAIFNEFLVTLKVVFKIKGECNASNDAISVVSVTNSNSLVHKTTIVKRFDTKSIAYCQCAILDEFLVTFHWVEIASSRCILLCMSEI